MRQSLQSEPQLKPRLSERKNALQKQKNYTEEADTIAPLNEEVAGIEKEDTVLLESDNFANPEDSVIDVESSEDAKKASALEESNKASMEADNNAEKGEAK